MLLALCLCSVCASAVSAGSGLVCRWLALMLLIEKASLRLDAAGPNSLQERGAHVKAPAKGPTARPPRALPSAQDLALLAKYDMFGQLLQAAAAAPQAQARPWPCVGISK